MCIWSLALHIWNKKKKKIIIKTEKLLYFVSPKNISIFFRFIMLTCCLILSYACCMLKLDDCLYIFILSHFFPHFCHQILQLSFTKATKLPARLSLNILKTNTGILIAQPGNWIWNGFRASTNINTGIFELYTFFHDYDHHHHHPDCLTTMMCDMAVKKGNNNKQAAIK